MWLVSAVYLSSCYIECYILLNIYPEIINLPDCCTVTVLLEYLDLYVIVVYNYMVARAWDPSGPACVSVKETWLKPCTVIVIWYVVEV